MYPLSKRASALKAVSILAVYLLVPSLLLLFTMAAISVNEARGIPDTLAAIISMFGYITAISLIVKRGSGVPFAERTGLRFYRHSSKVYGLAIITGLALGFAVALALPLLPPELVDAYDEASLRAFEGEGRFLAMLMAVVFSPLSEELVFRGFILKTLLRGFSRPVAVTACAAVFGLLHMNAVWSVYAFLMGLLFGRISEKTDNLAVAMAMHTGFNLTSIFGLFYGHAGIRVLESMWVVVCLCISAVCASVFLLKKLLTT